ncbi:MAG: hypothetical protein KIT56_10610 [Gammaproteobacteria bacterium]|nr:hypothetical protein [Gammaproteobacteria bacterium]
MESRKNDEQQNLSSLPDEVLLRIATLSGASGFYNLVRTSKGMSSLCLFKEYQQTLELLRKLLSHGALGELEAAEKIWREHPDLLTLRGTVFLSSESLLYRIPFAQNPGRPKYVNRTFWQILIMNEEYEEAEEAGKLMTAEEKQKQFAEIFPDGKMIKYDWDSEEAKKLLQAVFDAITDDDTITWNNETQSFEMSDTTRQKLHALYQYAKPKSEHEIGLVFPADFYLAALTMYDNHADKKFGNKWNKYSLWSVCVEEWLAGCLGTGFLRSHSQGIGNKSHRSGCVLADGSSYFRRHVDSIPGVHFFVGYYGTVMCGGVEERAIAAFFRNLCQAKTRARTEFMRQYVLAEKSTCLVC